MNLNDWIYLSVVPASVIAQEYEKILFFGYIINIIMALCILIIAVCIILSERQAIKREESQRISLMLSQIKPHFLYNTLSAIRSMIEIDPNEARKLVYNFSKYMRTNIDSLTYDELVPFEKELAHTKAYTDIQNVRFEGKVNITYDINSINFMLPPLTVQPIVENAIKHGIRKNFVNGSVVLTSNENKKWYIITIEDNDCGFDKSLIFDTPKKKSTGLTNVSYRINKMCRGKLEITSVPNEGTKVEIFIPKNKSKKGIVNENDIS